MPAASASSGSWFGFLRPNGSARPGGEAPSRGPATAFGQQLDRGRGGQHAQQQQVRGGGTLARCSRPKWLHLGGVCMPASACPRRMPACSHPLASAHSPRPSKAPLVLYVSPLQALPADSLSSLFYASLAGPPPHRP